MPAMDKIRGNGLTLGFSCVAHAYSHLFTLLYATIVLVLGYMLVSDAYRYETLMTAGVTTFILVVALARRPGKASLQTA